MREKRERVEILGVLIDKVSRVEALSKLEEFINSGDSHLVVTPNAEMIIRAMHNKKLKGILNSADMLVPDGAGVVLASRLLRNPLLERVAGIDIVEDLLDYGSKERYTFYFLGSTADIVEEAKNNVLKRYPNLEIYIHHGYLNSSLEESILSDIKSREVDVLLVGMGVPVQEIWLDRHLNKLGVPVGIGVGGTFDILAGKKERAPDYIQKLHLEWLYRLLQEPSRVGRMTALPKFVYEVIKEKVKKSNKLK